jgi:hypothetical protein
MAKLLSRDLACILVCLWLLPPLVAGCDKGDGRATVRGRVTLNGAPLESGLIELVPVTGSAGLAAGGVIENGSYAITRKGPLPGNYQVRITAWRKTGQVVEVPTIGPGAIEGAMMEEKAQYIPQKYNTNSELVVEIEAGRNRHDFELEGRENAQ